MCLSELLVDCGLSRDRRSRSNVSWLRVRQDVAERPCHLSSCMTNKFFYLSFVNLCLVFTTQVQGPIWRWTEVMILSSQRGQLNFRGPLLEWNSYKQSFSELLMFLIDSTKKQTTVFDRTHTKRSADSGWWSIKFIRELINFICCIIWLFHIVFLSEQQ